jgi:hypothetical protein
VDVYAHAGSMNGRIVVQSDPERAAFDAVARIYSPEDGSLVWDGDAVRPAEPDERTLLMLASAVFRVRFSDSWPMDTAV